MNKLQSINVVQSQPAKRPTRPNNLGNGIKPFPNLTPDTPCNTPNVPKPEIIISEPEQLATSHENVDSDKKLGAPNSQGELSTIQITVDSASNPGFAKVIGEKMETTVISPVEEKVETTVKSPIGEKLVTSPVVEKVETTITSSDDGKTETTVTSTTTTSKTENQDGNISFHATVVTTTKIESSKTESHSVTSPISNVTLSSTSEEPIGEIISQIVTESFNKNAAAASDAKVSPTVNTSNDDKKHDDETFKYTPSDGYPPVYTNPNFVAVCPRPPSPELEIRTKAEVANQEPKSEGNQENDVDERPVSTFEAFKNFVGGIMTSAVNAVSSHHEKIEPTEERTNGENKLEATVTIDSAEDKVDSKIETDPKPTGKSEFATTQLVTSSSLDASLSSPGLVKKAFSTKVEIIPSEPKDENDLVSASATKESSSFVELSNGFHKEETTSMVIITTSQAPPESKTELSTSPKTDVASSESLIEFKSAYEESHTATSSLETTTSTSTYYEASSTSYESATEHISRSHDHIGTHDASKNDTHDYSSFDVD